MTILVDTNIIISAIINPTGKEFAILKKNSQNIEFISSSVLVTEFSKKIDKIASINGRSGNAITKSFKLITELFFLVDVAQLDSLALQKAEELIKDLDNNDYSFLAITIYFDALFWTGDLKLYRGLRRKGFNNVITTKELKEILNGL